jgi:glyoxylase-like metal-dependent hydrolase (beta-lactamase superfamily II)
MGRRALFAHSAEEEDLARLRSLHRQGRLALFETELQVGDGVLVEVLGGHTPGQAVITVATERGGVILASDAVHYYDEVTLDRPFVHMADLPASYAAFDTLSRREAELGQVLVAGHDPLVIDRFPALAPELPWAIRVG